MYCTRLLLVSVALMAIGGHLTTANVHGEKMDMAAFKQCVLSCQKVLMDCWRPVIPLLKVFQDNVRKIIGTLSGCCLKGEHEHDIDSNTSFATCTRDKCAARLWGCQFKKVHQGTKSKAEREFIKRKKNKRKGKK